MKAFLSLLLAAGLVVFTVGCQQEVGSGNTNEGTEATENYDDPNYVPSYADLEEGDGPADTGGGDDSSAPPEGGSAAPE